MNRFWQGQFDKLLLSSLFLILLAVSVVFQPEISWTQRLADMAFGALIGIITGRSANRSTDKDRNQTDKENRDL